MSPLRNHRRAAVVTTGCLLPMRTGCGCIGTQHSPRPHFSERTNLQTSDAWRREIAKLYRLFEVVTEALATARNLAVRRHGDPGAIAPAHQHAILGLAEIGDAHREPDTDR